MISIHRINAMDRSKVAYHEAGHVFMARQYDVEASASIWPQFTSYPELEKAWCGQTQLKYLANHPIRKRVAAAGAGAEVARAVRLTPYVGIDDIFELAWDYVEVMSESDLEMIGDLDLDETIDLVAFVAEEILSHFEELRNIARELIREGVV